MNFGKRGPCPFSLYSNAEHRSDSKLITKKHFGWVMSACWEYGPLARYVKLRVAHAPGMPGTFSPPPRVSNPDMHVPWCIPGSFNSGFLCIRWWGNVPGIPGACATRNFTYLVRGPLWDPTAPVLFKLQPNIHLHMIPLQTKAICAG